MNVWLGDLCLQAAAQAASGCLKAAALTESGAAAGAMSRGKRHPILPYRMLLNSSFGQQSISVSQKRQIAFAAGADSL